MKRDTLADEFAAAVPDGAQALAEATGTAAPAQAEGAGMSDAELLAVLEEELRDAEALTDTVIGPERDKALNYYLGRPMGDEQEGRSSVISREVYKVVEGVATAVVELYVQAKDPIRFSPRSKDDEAKAAQRTATAEHVFFTQNDGFLAIVEAVKDGILLKTGYLSWRWEKELRLTRERYRGQTYIQLALLQMDNPSLRVVSLTPGTPDPMTGEATYDVVIDVVNESGSVKIEAVAPEEIVVGSRARSANLQRAPAVTWRSRKTRTELLKCGYDRELIDSLTFTSEGAANDSGIQRQRQEVDSAAHGGEARINTTWIELDRDDDGIVELHRVVWSPGVLLEDEIVSEIELAGWTPIVQPHEFFGRSPADDATESQEVMSTLKRQMLNSLYHANNPMWRVSMSDKAVRVEDFYEPDVGKPVRADKDAAEPIIFPFVGQHTFPALEYEQADQENKTGFTRYSQGLDAKSLNQTARGISIISSMSQQRVRMMARLFGELCLKPALRGVARLLAEHGEKPLSVRLNGEYVEVDPREWREEFDMTVDVGLGVTDREQQLMHLTSIEASQMAAVQGGGLGTLVTPKNLYNVQVKKAELAGFKDPTFAWNDPSTASPPAPKPDPEEVKQRHEDERHAASIEADLTKATLQSDTQIELKRMELAAQAEREARALDTDMQRAALEGDTHVRVAEASRQPGAQVNIDGQGTIAQLAQAMQAMAEQQAQAIAVVMHGQQAMLAALDRMSAPKRVLRGADGRVVGVTSDPDPSQPVQ